MIQIIINISKMVIGWFYEKSIIVWVKNQYDDSPYICDLCGNDSTVSTDMKGKAIVHISWLNNEITIFDSLTKKYIKRHVLVKTPGKRYCEIVIPTSIPIKRCMSNLFLEN